MGTRRPSDLPGDVDDLIGQVNSLERFNFLEARHLIGGAGEPAFANGWTNFGGGESVANFYKYRERVYLGGLVKSGTVGATMFTLPVGYRPGGNVRFAVISNGAFGYFSIDSAGAANLGVGSNVFVDLSPVNFQVG